MCHVRVCVCVVLWFVLLGPIGAWAFRTTDLMRRRAVFESERREHDGETEAPFLRPLQNLHGLLVWLPSRLAAMSFALAGSFEPATTANACSPLITATVM